MGSLTTPVQRATRSSVKRTTTNSTSTSNSSSNSSSDCSDSEAVVERLSISRASSISSLDDVESTTTPAAKVAKHTEKIPEITTKNDFSVLNEPWTLFNFYKKLDWVHVLGLVFMPLYGFYAAFAFVPLEQKTAIFAVAYYFFTGLGITAGKDKEQETRRLKMFFLFLWFFHDVR